MLLLIIMGVFTIFKRTIIIDLIICFLLASMNPPMAIALSPSDLVDFIICFFIGINESSNGYYAQPIGFS